ncbi:hypothetical protein HF984_02665 [Rothia terrae]|jgi:hypothetical protein|uniref:hypothetical protein n=1 Tax=Rothia terrae TaxID=396015 RepID=UPI001447632A|nr:hypothetical protein [Rothia terrae]MDT0189670.1 hypothetical protein [Rothia terrae]NKZ33686.1 hypothetical protein [Rothia terrae]
MKSQYLQNPPVRFRPKTAVFYTVVAVVIAVVLVAATLYVYGVYGMVAKCWPWFFLAYGVWYLLGYPSFEVDRDELCIKNPFVSHRVGYPNLIDISTKFNLTLVTARKKYQAFAVPSTGMRAGLHTREEEITNLPSITYGGHGSVRTSDLPTGFSGSAAMVARGYWQEIVEDEALSTFPGIEESTFDVKGGVIFALLAFAAAVSVFL